MHQLFYSPNSPYARKCRVIIIEKELEEKVRQVKVNTAETPPELLAVNPLGKVPALLTRDGMALCDSPLICEFLDREPSSLNNLFPASRNEYFPVLALAALADGVMDAAVEIVLQNRRAEALRWNDWIARKEQAILRTLDSVAKHELPGDEILNIGTLGLACALAYLHFRLPHLQWERQHPVLEQWLGHVLKRPSFQHTKPET